MSAFQLIFVFLTVINIWRVSGITKGHIYTPMFQSMLNISLPSLVNVTLNQISRNYDECDDYAINYKFLDNNISIGPILSSYSGIFGLSGINTSQLWENYSFTIDVLHQPPQVPSKKIIVDEGSPPIQLNCTYKSNCNIKNKIGWYLKNIRYFLEHGVKYVKSVDYNHVIVMTILRLTGNYQHISTVYKCGFREKTKYRAEVYLEVKGFKKPKMAITDKIEEESYIEHKTAEIIVEISGSPLPNLTCIHAADGTEMLSCTSAQMKKVMYDPISTPCIAPNGGYQLSSRITQTDSVIIQIQQVQFEKDNGTMLCTLQNSKYKREEFRLDINVHVPPEVSMSKSKNYSNTIDCTIKANPLPTINWNGCFYNTTDCRSLETDSTKKEIDIITYKSSVTISNATIRYVVCEAKNVAGSSSKIIYLLQPSLEKENQGDKGNIHYVIYVLPVVLLSLLFGAVVFLLKKRRKQKIHRSILMGRQNYTIDPTRTLNEQMHSLSYTKDWEFPYNNLEFLELIGCGAFGKVYKARACNIGLFNSRDKGSQANMEMEKLVKCRRKIDENDSTIVAVKTTKDNPSIDDIRILAGELKIMIHVKVHENIVNVLGACTRYPKLYVILEYCAHGSLLEFLRKKRNIFEPIWDTEEFSSNKMFTTANILMAAIQVANGMKFLVSEKCVHRDLAARNVLVAENYVMKVADFGLARTVLHSTNYISSTHGYLPIKWMAPESILSKVFSEKSDVWSFGVLLWEMITLGMTPYPTIPIEDFVDYLKDGVRMVKPSSCPDELYKIMESCWKTYATERPSFDQLHTRLSNLLNENIEKKLKVPTA